MTNVPNDVYWDVDGESLQTYAYNIVTLGGGRDNVPPIRGANRAVPYHPGTFWLPKYPDERVISLGMWVRGANPNSPANSSADETLFWQNWRMLKQLLWRGGSEEFDLTKRWYEGSVIFAIARAEYAGGLELASMGNWGGQFVVDLRLADPYFYGEEITTDIAATLTGTDTPVTINNPGDAPANWTDVSVVFTGPLVNPVLTNLSPDPNFELALGMSIADGEAVTVDVANALAYDQDGNNVVNFLTHSGSRSYFGLLRGDNLLRLVVDDGLGTANVTFHPPYL